MMSLRINEAGFLLILFIVAGSLAPNFKKTAAERERAGPEFSLAGAGVGGAIGVPLCLLFLYASRRE